MLRIPSFDNSDRVVLIYNDLYEKSRTIPNIKLHDAASEGDTSLINFFVTDKGMSVDALGQFGMTPLSVAAAFGHINAIDALLNLGADINAPDAIGNSPLISAITDGEIPSVEYLLEKGANIDQANIADETPIMFAVRHGRPEIFRILASRGVSLTHTDVTLKTILHRALIHSETPDRVGMVETILDTVVDWPEPGIVNWPEPILGGFPLHWAAYHGYVDIVDVLLERGARLDAKNKDGELPIHVAARAGQKEAFLKLKDANPDLLNAVDNEGRTPIVTAQKHNSQGILSALGL